MSSPHSKLDGGIDISFDDDRHYRHVTLRNKLTVVLIQDEKADKVSAAMNVSAGYFFDPEFAPGLANLCGHMLFMGSEKYPNESDFEAYLVSHGGESKGCTTMEDTNYSFRVTHDNLEGALDRFAQFFTSPLFIEGSIFRAIQTIDSESAKKCRSDTESFKQLQFLRFAKKDHPMSKFGPGNLHTLKDMPKAVGKDIREELLAFYDAHYSANLMGLVVVGREPLDQLQAMVEAKFSDIPNKDLPTPSFPCDPFPPSSFGVEAHVTPSDVLHSNVRGVTLSWPVPSQRYIYLAKPYRYVAHLMEQEGPGSILSLLRERYWADDLSARLTEKTNSTCALFEVAISQLSQEGFDALHDVVGVVYEYIAMLQREGPQAWVWEELKAMQDINLWYKDKDPLECAVDVSKNLLRMPVKHAVASFDQRLFEFDPTGITDFLNRLKPEGALILVKKQELFNREVEVVQKEAWSKTEYCLCPVSPTVLQQWGAPPTISPELKLPVPNELLASTDFSLRPYTGPGAEPTREQTDVGGSAYAPVVLKDTPLTRLWFKQDLWYKKPKMYVSMQLESPVANESPEASLYTDIFVRLVHDDLNYYGQAVVDAGVAYGLRENMKGLHLSFTGFVSHKLPLHVLRVVRFLAQFQLEDHHESEAFARIVDTIGRDYERADNRLSLDLADSAYNCATHVPSWTPLEILQVLGDATVEGLRAFLPRLLGQMHLEVLMYGNVNSEDALQLMESIERELGASALLPEQRRAGVVRRVALEPGTTYVRAVAGGNFNEQNSALQMVFEVGSGDDMESYAILTLISDITSSDVFRQQRSLEKELGYTVEGRVEMSPSDLLTSFRLTVKSEKANPANMDWPVENFLRMLRWYMGEMSDEAFEMHRTAAMALSAVKDTAMLGERNRHWAEIISGRYLFNNATLLTAALGKVTREALLHLFDLYIAAGGERRKKFSSEVFSAAHGVPPAHRESSAHVVYVNDVPAFKRSMSLAPPKFLHSNNNNNNKL